MTGCQVFPPELPEDICKDPKRRAEVAVFDALKTQLKDPAFHVFYSKEWLNKAFVNIHQEDGECDFVIAHPDMGILFIEVKGGPVRKDGSTGQWFSGPHRIKNPIYQAKTSKHYFREALHTQWADMPFLKLVHCVLLPDSSPHTSYFGEGLPVEIFGFMDDMPKLAKKVYSFFEFETANDHRISGSLGKYGIEILKKMFAKNLDFSPRLAGLLHRDSFLIDELTQNQQSRLQMAENLDRVLFTGPAGSGKTMLAIGKAINEARDYPEESVLFLCFNSALTHYLKSRIEDVPPNLEIRTFHSFCRMLAVDSHQITQAEVDSDPEKFFSLSTNHALDALSEIGPVFRSVFVDEGQDFEAEWWDVIQLCIKESSRNRLWVFLDDNQNIRRTNLPEITDLHGPLRLFEILRSTKSIGETTTTFYRGDSFTLIGPEGQPVDFIECQDELKTVTKLVNRYVSYEGINPNEIAVITIQALNRTCFSDVQSIGQFRVFTCDRLGEGLVVDSSWRFKGLEAEVVILCGFPEGHPGNEILYVGTSRAKTFLSIVGSPAVFDYLNTAFD